MADSTQPYAGTQMYLAVEAVHAELADPTVLLQFGRDALDANKQRRRIVWVRPGGTCQSPSRGGGMYRSPEEAAAEPLPTTGAPAATPQGNRTQFCYEPVDAVVAHLYAETDATLERLFYNLLAAIKKSCGHMATPGTYVWPQELAAGSLGQRQPKLELQINFTFAAPEEVTGPVMITGVQHTHRMNGNAGGSLDTEHS